MVLEVGVSAVEDVADVHRFLVLPLERKTSIDFFFVFVCFFGPFSGNLRGKGFRCVNKDGERMRKSAVSVETLSASLSNNHISHPNLI